MAHFPAKKCSRFALWRGLAASLLLLSGIRLGAGEPAKPQAPAPAAPAKASPTAQAGTSNLREALLLSVAVKSQILVSRMLVTGKCIGYLSQRIGFSTTLPTTNRGDDYAPTASPDGLHIAFYSSRNGAANLYVADADGRGQRALTDEDQSIQPFNAAMESPIQFTPDSKRLVYLSGGNLWTCDLNGDNLTSFTQGGGVEAFSFSPDGKWIAYFQRGSIHRVAASGQPDEVVVVNNADWPTLAWGPDPKKPEIYYFFKGLWKVDANTRQRSLLASSYTYPNRARIAPKSGETIAYVSLSQELRPEIYLANLAKKTASGRAESSVVTQGGGTAPFYSADGKTLYFERQGGLWSIGLGGEKVRLLQNLPSFHAVSVNLDFPLPGECSRP